MICQTGDIQLLSVEDNPTKDAINSVKHERT